LEVENADQKNDSHERPTANNTESNKRREDGHSFHNAPAKVIRKTAVNALEVLSKPVEEPTSRNGIMESDFREENAFQESLVKDGGGINRTSVENEPPQSRENQVETSDGSVNADVPHRAFRGLVTQRRASPPHNPTVLHDRSEGGENERAEEDDTIPGATGSTDIS
jgi:hypothetical protein